MKIGVLFIRLFIDLTPFDIYLVTHPIHPSPLARDEEEFKREVSPPLSSPLIALLKRIGRIDR